MKSYGKQAIDQSDIDAVVAVLKSDFLTQGPAITAFQTAIATKTTSRYAIAAANATACLHIACLALGVSENDIVWTSPISFVASANCALYCGADIDFVDIDLDTGLMSLAALERKLEVAKQLQKLPKVVIPVHLCGQSCDMAAIYQLAQEYGFKIIEDASHAIGGTYQNMPIGNCKYSDICVFSFHPVKIITTGEGGVATTNSPQLAKKMQQFVSHGITREPELLQNPSHGPWYYEQLALGFNYRMTDIQAALGLSQLDKLDQFVAIRNNLAALYQNKLAELNVTMLTVKQYGLSSYHLLVVLLDNAEQRLRMYHALQQAGIGVNVHYIPIYLQPYYQAKGFLAGYCPNAENYYSKALTLPLHPQLSEQDIETIVSNVKNAL
ncbi:UDP-4-amino-4,6-dideoxy-N-acetyl-beta-L-altrosamine transaminase [Pseudoalteromonas fenneropenaei]|uniref:UDP-4-amino-4, 6-dideoxy-N-acetyl-beta-L-altrosamine transaminase n=1 Tax=Pseudoalteromonas fenneropenaei TaxID=1737459 RepID=A0ABV7CGT9_9GAMM